MKILHIDTGFNGFDSSCRQAKSTAVLKSITVQFDFNDVVVVVNENTNLQHLLRDYRNAYIMKWKKIGPNCVESYAKSLKAELKRTEAIEKKRIAKSDADYRAKLKKQTAQFEKKVKGVKLELKDEKGWLKSRKANTDPYGKCALDYAEVWMKLMQQEIAKGKTVEQCAGPLKKELSFLGITGAMYGCVIGILSQVWKHGGKLRVWHNKEYGARYDRKGVVNPAVLTIRTN